LFSQLSPKRKLSPTEETVSENENSLLHQDQAGSSTGADQTDNRTSKISLLKKKFRRTRPFSTFISRRSRPKYRSSSLSTEENSDDQIVQENPQAFSRNSSIPNGAPHAEHCRKNSTASEKQVPTVVVVEVEPDSDDLQSNSTENPDCCSCVPEQEVNCLLTKCGDNQPLDGAQEQVTSHQFGNEHAVQETDGRLPALVEDSADECV